jgi:Protein of unknown function (DUF3800)
VSLFAYVDETGDRGTSAKSSRYFAMAGITVAGEDEAAMRAAIGVCRKTLGTGTGLHWQEHIKTFPRRQYVIGQLAALPGVSVNYVVFEKAAIPTASGLHHDHVLFYNYAAGLMMERLLLTAKGWPGGSRPIIVKFAHVRGFNHTDTLAYFGVKRAKDPSWMPWHLLNTAVKFVPATQYDGIQLADIYAGALNSAISMDRYGGYEPQHLLAIKHQIRRYRGTTWGAGFKAMALPNSLQGLPWWPPTGLD